MITFLDPELYRAEASPWFSAQALAQGADAARVEKLVQAAAAVADEDFVIDTERAISRLLENGPPAAEASSGYYADMLYRSAWKLQGTDGVRGIVASSGDPDYALRRYLAERLITPEFCRLYAAGFIALLERGSIRESGQESIPADAHRQSGDVSVEYCREYPAALVIGEDGRDWYAGTGLKAAVLDVALKKVLRVVDLGIVPTPYLAAYTQRFACAGIMLTASHNPAEENGLKLFVNGRKLYP